MAWAFLYLRGRRLIVGSRSEPIDRMVVHELSPHCDQVHERHRPNRQKHAAHSHVHRSKPHPGPLSLRAQASGIRSAAAGPHRPFGLVGTHSESRRVARRHDRRKLLPKAKRGLISKDPHKVRRRFLVFRILIFFFKNVRKISYSCESKVSQL